MRELAMEMSGGSMCQAEGTACANAKSLAWLQQFMKKGA